MVLLLSGILLIIHSTTKTLKEKDRTNSRNKRHDLYLKWLAVENYLRCKIAVENKLIHCVFISRSDIAGLDASAQIEIRNKGWTRDEQYRTSGSSNFHDCYNRSFFKLGILSVTLNTIQDQHSKPFKTQKTIARWFGREVIRLAI